MAKPLTPLVIGILETGRPPEELRVRYGSYADMFQRFLGSAESDFEFRVYAVLDNELPPEPQACSAWLVTGSRHGVYEDLAWMRNLQSFIREVWAARVPMIGICFGHQIIAAALGGRVEKSAKGWGIGLHHYQVTKTLDWLDSVDSFTVNAMHQDQVVECPPAAEVFASSAFCEYAGLIYGDSILTFQGHPEFTNEFERDLLTLRKGSVIPTALAEPALEQLASGQLQPEARANRWLARFLHPRA